MAQESKRGCGYRVVGGLYLCGEYRPVYCDRLPYPLDICPVCSHGIKPSRSYTKVNPLRLFGLHEQGYTKLYCTDDNPNCFLCVPSEDPAFIMTVGESSYSPESFTDEASRLGVSKRIPFMPKELVLGQTVVYLAHAKACRISQKDTLPLTNGSETMETDLIEYKYGIFTAFIAQRVEKLIWRHDATEDELKRLEKRGITPVIIEDGDTDHANLKKTRQFAEVVA